MEQSLIAIKKKYPKHLSEYYKPIFYDQKPTEKLSKQTVVESVEIYNGYILSEGDGYMVILNVDHYHCDHDLTISKDKVRIEEIPNPNYKKELERYQKRKEDHKKELVLWEQFKKEIDEFKKVKADKAEKALYNKLKEKYEKI